MERKLETKTDFFYTCCSGPKPLKNLNFSLSHFPYSLTHQRSSYPLHWLQWVLHNLDQCSHTVISETVQYYVLFLQVILLKKIIRALHNLSTKLTDAPAKGL